jgi:hypothetical protein
VKIAWLENNAKMYIHGTHVVFIIWVAEWSPWKLQAGWPDAFAKKSPKMYIARTDFVKLLPK